MKINLKGALDVIIVAALVALTYIAFTPLFNDEHALIVNETISAAAGAILAAAFTWALLTRQSKAARDNALLDKRLEILTDKLNQISDVTEKLLDEAAAGGKIVSNLQLNLLYHKLLSSQITLSAVMPSSASSRLRKITEKLYVKINSHSLKQKEAYKFLIDDVIEGLYKLSEECGITLDIVDKRLDQNENSDDEDSEPVQYRNEENLNIMAITINNINPFDLSKRELKERVSYAWRINLERAKKADYVLAVNKGVCFEVYKPVEWLEATRINFPKLKEDFENRYGFNGDVAEEAVRELFLNKSLEGALKRQRGMATLVLYNYN